MFNKPVEEFGGMCPHCDSPLIQYSENNHGALEYEVCPTCSYGNGRCSSDINFPSTPKAISIYVWQKLLKRVGVDNFYDVKEWYEGEVQRYYTKTVDRTKDRFYPRMIKVTHNSPREYLLKNNLEDKGLNLKPLKTICTCESIDLFHYGCRCGHMSEIKALQEIT